MIQQDKISKELKEYFKDKGITQEEIAQKVGTTQQVVSRLLNGKAFGKKTAATWSEQFGFNPAWLITGEGARFLSEKEQEINTAKKVVEMGTQIFAEQILQMINEGVLYPASVIKEKNEEIQRKEQEIQKLNRELGSLTKEVEKLSNELKEKTGDAPAKTA